MDKNQEPILTDVKLSPEELAMRQRQTQGRKPTVARTSSSADQESKSPLTVVALLLAFVSAGAAGYLFLELQKLQQDLRGSKTALESQTQNLSVLNDKLSVTGENANLSVDALKVQITQLNNEVQRLQDSVKKDRADINSTAKDVQGLKAAAAQAVESLANNDKKNLEQDEGAADLNKRIEKNTAQLKALPEIDLRLSQQADSLSGQQKELTALKKELAQMKKSGLGAEAAQLRLQIEDLNTRIDRLQAPAATAK